MKTEVTRGRFQKLWPAGGAEGVRTPDLLNAIQALYQLSYDPDQSGANVSPAAKLSKPKTPIQTQVKNFTRRIRASRIFDWPQAYSCG